MRVRMKTTMAGPQGCARPGDEREFDQATGEALVRGGYAELLDGSLSVQNPSAETTAAPGPPENNAAAGNGKPKPTDDDEESETNQPSGETNQPADEATDATDEADPTLDELGIDGNDAALLKEKNLLTRSAIEEFDAGPGLESIKHIGKVSAGEIRELIALSYEE